jgi:hypothetical protein
MRARFWRALTRSTVPDIASRPAIRLFAHLRPRQLRGASVVEAVEALFGPMTRGAALELTRRMAVNGFRNGCVRRLGHAAGPAAIVHLVRDVSAESIRQLPLAQPAILVFWHLGPATDVLAGAVFEGLGRPLLLIKGTLRDHAVQNPEGLEYVAVGDARARAYALKRSLEHLGRGGLVALALDGHGERMVELPFFGRRYQFGRGAATLSRMTGAPILPIVKTWGADATIRIRSDAALSLPAAGSLAPEEFDRAATQEVVRWFEAFLRAEPEQFRLSALPRLWRAEAVEGPDLPDRPQCPSSPSAPST